ncbi:hypothetical protein GCM10023322_06490 [Rugosimonospora acidiphila]|uniref:Uncharacterized protein n=1 Tax=Rugosimonospora acidiphila TaxID=556531 RepID=A0ABP9RJ56_9ACTN
MRTADGHGERVHAGVAYELPCLGGIGAHSGGDVLFYAVLATMAFPAYTTLIPPTPPDSSARPTSPGTATTPGCS